VTHENNSKLGECTTLWGEREQAACVLATEERMKYQNDVNSCRKFVVASACGGTAQFASTSLAWHTA